MLARLAADPDLRVQLAAAKAFIKELQGVGKVSRKQAKIGVVANRVREYTLIFEELDEYLSGLKVPYIAALREAQNYIRAYQRGIGIHGTNDPSSIATLPCPSYRLNLLKKLQLTTARTRTVIRLSSVSKTRRWQRA